MELGLTFDSAAPQSITSAVPRATCRNASPTASRPAASSHVIALLGPWQSQMMPMWHDSMLGRNFSSHSGNISGMPSAPHLLSRTFPPSSMLAAVVGPNSSISAGMNPAP